MSERINTSVLPLFNSRASADVTIYGVTPYHKAGGAGGARAGPGGGRAERARTTDGNRRKDAKTFVCKEGLVRWDRRQTCSTLAHDSAALKSSRVATRRRSLCRGASADEELPRR